MTSTTSITTPDDERTKPSERWLLHRLRGHVLAWRDRLAAVIRRKTRSRSGTARVRRANRTAEWRQWEAPSRTPDRRVPPQPPA